MKVRHRAVPKSAPAAGKRRPSATVEYVHLPLGEDVLAFAGYYTPEQEIRLPFHGREVLYTTGHIVVESACHGGACTPQNYWYAFVQGYLVNWQHRRNESGLPVSEVEPISNRETRKEIEDIVLRTESVSRVDFR